MTEQFNDARQEGPTTAPTEDTHSEDVQSEDVQSEAPTPLTDIEVQLSGQDGNAFAILGRVSAALRRGGRRDLVDAFTSEATSGDYENLLAVCARYVHVG